MSNQLSLLPDELVLPPGGPKGPALTMQDDLPPGPFKLSQLFDMTMGSYTPPFSVVASNGRTVAGQCPSLSIARAIRDALNLVYPAAGAAA